MAGTLFCTEGNIGSRETSTHPTSHFLQYQEEFVLLIIRGCERQAFFDLHIWEDKLLITGHPLFLSLWSALLRPQGALHCDYLAQSVMQTSAFLSVSETLAYVVTLVLSCMWEFPYVHV